MTFRDVAVVGFAHAPHVRRTDGTTNGVEMLMPCFHSLYEELGLQQTDIGFWCSGSCDYLAGRAFSFISAIDSIGAVPPINESHVEMDGAWALYEAYIKLLTGEVDTALVYGFGKSSAGTLRRVLALQTDPYTVAPLWPDSVSMAGLQARFGLDAGKWTAEQMAQVALDSFAASGRTDSEKPAKSVDELLARPFFADPLRRHDIAPITDGASAIVLAAGDKARELRENPAWITGIEHRIETPVLGARDLTTSPSTQASAKAATGGDVGSIEIAEIYAPFTHQQLILTEAIGLPPSTKINPSGGPLAANPMFSAGLERIGFAAQHIFHARQAGYLRTRPAVRSCNRISSPCWKGNRNGGPIGRGARHRPDEIRRQAPGRLDERSGSRGYRQGIGRLRVDDGRHRRRSGRQGTRLLRGRHDAGAVHGRRGGRDQ